jgi:hypothetical protein
MRKNEPDPDSPETIFWEFFVGPITSVNKDGPNVKMPDGYYRQVNTAYHSVLKSAAYCSVLLHIVAYSAVAAVVATSAPAVATAAAAAAEPALVILGA